MREKLIELLCEAKSKSADDAWFSDATYAEQLAMEADHLIANGVTVTDNNVGGKCDYCQEDAEGYRKMIGAFAITNPFHGSTWQIETAHCKPRQIFFCPMCGRKLTDHRKENQAVKQLFGKSEQFKWIPVTERLPKEEWECWTAQNDWDVYPCLAAIQTNRGGRYVSKLFFTGENFVDDEYVRYTAQVTHWMPLPEPPKGE